MQMRKTRNTLCLAAAAAAAIGAGAAHAAAGDWLVRARLIQVSPNDSTGPVSGIAGTEAAVSDDTTLELDFTRMLTDHVGLELILATTRHGVKGSRGAVAGADVGSVRVLPPTLTLQYHPQPDAKVRPYVGIGVNYTLFYDKKAGAGLGAGATVDYDSSWGLAAQAGVDMDLGGRWFLNADVKYIDMDTTLTVRGGAVPGTTKVKLNPWVFAIGVGTRF